MKNTVARAMWGIIFVIFGISLAGKAFGLFEFNIFFRGWWTLFIIIPCAIGLIERENRSASGIGLGIGILLLVSAQGIFRWYMLSRLFVAFLFIMIGYRIMTRESRKEQTNNQFTSSNESSNYTGNQDSSNDQNYSNDQYSNQNSYQNNNDSGDYGNSYYHSTFGGTNHGGNNHFSAILGGRNIHYSEEIFTGAVISSILGNMQLDLRKAIFNGDAVIDTTCILGGIDIFLPANVRVMVNCTPILGGVDNKAIPPYENGSSSYTVFINGTCILGGVVVK